MNTLKDFVNWKLSHADKVAEAEGYPLVMENCKKNKRMKQLEIYGNSVQDGTPTPEAPVEVISVGDLSVNILPNAKDIYNGGGDLVAHSYKEVIEDGRECISFTSARGITYDKIKFKENTQYTFSFDCKDFVHDSSYTGNYDIPFGIWYTDGNRKLITIPKNSDWTKLTIVSDANKTVSHIGMISFTSYTTMYIDINTFQIAEGTTAEYEPYGKYKIPVVQRGINLFDVKTYPLTTGHWINGNTGLYLVDKMYAATQDFIPCADLIGKTITISRTGGINPGIAFYDDNKTYVSGKENSNSAYNKLTTTVPENAVYYRFCVVADYKDTAQIQEGSTVLPYEPYIEPITTNVFLNEPLRKIGDYADYVDFKNNKVVRHIKECVLDGVSTGMKITAVTLYSNGLYYSLCDGQRGISNGAENVLKNTHFKASTKLEKGQCYMTSNATACRMVHPNQELNTVELWNEWLQKLYNNSSPVTFDYVLKEPAEEPITIDLPKLNTKTSIIEVDTSLALSDAYGKYIKK